MAAEQIIRVLNEQRKRCQASILGAAEASAWWSHLTKEEQVNFRARVLDSISVFYDLCRDVLKSSEPDDVVRNEHALQLLLDLHRRMDRITPHSDTR